MFSRLCGTSIHHKFIKIITKKPPITFFLIIALIATCNRAAFASETPSSNKEPISFNRLIMREKGKHDIFIAPDEFRVSIIEELRSQGYNALGAESILFDKDKSHNARYMIGGTINELECTGGWRYAKGHCRIAISWELYDRMRDRVIYTVLTRSASAGIMNNEKTEEMLHDLVIGALRSLTKRPKFNELLEKKTPLFDEKPAFPIKAYATCNAKKLTLPKDLPQVLKASVVIKANNGVGSGFFISPDGLILTANHVVDDASEIEVVLEDGKTAKGTLLRSDRIHDVALIRTDIKQSPCIALQDNKANVGVKIYAIGSPAGDELAFSVSQGIVSGIRNIKEMTFIQTDASINPGNSGGPLMDSTGQVIAIVSWKIAYTGFEGLGFGVPVSSALERLAIQSGEKTTLEMSPLQVAAADSTKYPIVDEPDVSSAELAAKEREKTERAQKAAFTQRQKRDKAYLERLKKWRTETNPIRKRRRGFAATGSVLTTVGACVMLGGVVFEVRAQALDDRVQYYHDKWYETVDSYQRDYYALRFEEYIDERDSKHGLGIGFMAAGGAVIATSIVLFVFMPSSPEPPPYTATDTATAKLNITPIVSPQNLGVNLTF